MNGLQSPSEKILTKEFTIFFVRSCSVKESGYGTKALPKALTADWIEVAGLQPA